MYQVNLIRQRESEGEIWVDNFNAEDSVVNANEALRNAVKEFLATEEGAKAVKQTCNDFNWGDVISYVPETIWNKYGLHYTSYPKSVDIFVNQDEVLCD